MFYKQFHKRFTWKIRGSESKLIQLPQYVQYCVLSSVITIIEHKEMYEKKDISNFKERQDYFLLYWKHLKKYWMLPCQYVLYIKCIHVLWQTQGVGPPFFIFFMWSFLCVLWVGTSLFKMFNLCLHLPWTENTYKYIECTLHAFVSIFFSIIILSVKEKKSILMILKLYLTLSWRIICIKVIVFIRQHWKPYYNRRGSHGTMLCNTGYTI